MTRRTHRVLTAAALLGALAAATGRGDDVRLKDGTLLQGKITMETPQKIVLQQAGGRRVLDRGDVASIVAKPFALPPARAGEAADGAGAGAPGAPAEAATAVAFWPPRPGEPYPDLVLRDSGGSLFRLSSLKGKVILLEPIGMTCEGCQALSGGRACGGYQGITPQHGLDSLESYLSQFGNRLTLNDPNVAYVQVVIYDMNMKAPSVAAVKSWADHFRLSNRANVHVLAGTPEMIGPASFAMIPGIHLIDRDFVLRSEFFGHGGGSDLFRDLLPMAGRLAASPN
jgi:hypothetical protein